MLESLIQSLYFWFKGWHFAVGERLCAPIAESLPGSISPHCPRFVDGFFTTFELVVLALILAFGLARLLTRLQILGPGWLRSGIGAYVYIFQGTPLLIQLWLVYFGLAQFEWIQASSLWLFLASGWWVGLLVLTLNSAAYQTNILTGGVRNLSKGQSEGADSLGLSERLKYHRVLFPQALRASWPALANESILLLKASALVSTITVLDLMGHARTVFSRSYDLAVYGGAAILYIALTALITLLAYLIRRYGFASLPSDPWFRGLMR
jgi:amine acid ABC transporter, permease protein, 3-TM region, His/Glu/Gln/Arg/opine family